MKSLSFYLILHLFIYYYAYLTFLSIQRKRVKRKKHRAEKKPTIAEMSPEALAETWKIVEEELRATGFQVCA